MYDVSENPVGLEVFFEWIWYPKNALQLSKVVMKQTINRVPLYVKNTGIFGRPHVDLLNDIRYYDFIIENSFLAFLFLREARESSGYVGCV